MKRRRKGTRQCREFRWADQSANLKLGNRYINEVLHDNINGIHRTLYNLGPLAAHSHEGGRRSLLALDSASVEQVSVT